MGKRSLRRGVLTVLAATFAGMLPIVNAALYVLVIRPLRGIVRIADQASLGDVPTAEFPTGGGREVAALAAAFNRMRKRLDKALRMLDSGAVAHDIFVSYSQPDRDCAFALVHRVDARDISVWTAPRDVAHSFLTAPRASAC